jgi:hypothetical protein
VAEVVQKGIFERLGLQLPEDWNMAFAELEELQKPEVYKQPSEYPPAFDLGMVEAKTDKVCAPSALKILILGHNFLSQKYSALE